MPQNEYSNQTLYFDQNFLVIIDTNKFLYIRVLPLYMQTLVLSNSVLKKVVKWDFHRVFQSRKKRYIKLIFALKSVLKHLCEAWSRETQFL